MTSIPGGETPTPKAIDVALANTPSLVQSRSRMSGGLATGSSAIVTAF
jgi:hypothetical protein